MALSDPSIQNIERLESKSSKKLPIPLEVCIAGRNLKITDYNELFDLNKINGDSRRITTLTIKTVSTYKQKVDSTNALDAANSNRESNKVLQSNREISDSLNLMNNNNKSSNDKENHRQVPANDLSRKSGNELTTSANQVNRKSSDQEQRKIKQITIQKSIQVDPRTKQYPNDDHQLNSRTYSSKAIDDTFQRNSKRSSSLRQINLFTKYGTSDLRRTDEVNSNQQYFVSDKFENNNSLSSTATTTNRLMSSMNEPMKNAMTGSTAEQKSKLFYFNGTNDGMMFKDEIDKLSSNRKQSTFTGATGATTSAIDEKFKKHLNASLNSSFNSNYPNHQSKDGNNNSSLKTTNTLINSRTNVGLLSKSQYGQSNTSPTSAQLNNPLAQYTNQQQAMKQSNQFTNQTNYLEQYHQQPNQQVNNSFMRKKQSSIRKLSAGGNVDEINCDEFVSELKTKIANNNQTTSSPATAAKLPFNSNSLGKQERTRHLILDTSTMPHMSRTKQTNSGNLVNNFETNQHIRPLLTSSIRRNESFQKATEHRIRMEPVKRPKDPNQSSRVLPTSMNVDTIDKSISQQNKNMQRFSYLGSQAANGFQSDNRQSNENLANETGTTTDDWNTTLDTNAETKSSFDDKSKQYKKCDKYGFFINEDDKKKSTRNGSIKEDEQTKRINLEIDKRREMKWLEMLNNWDRYMQKRWNKICERCRKGIPPSLRGRAWFYLCAAHKQKRHKPDLFHLLNQQPGNESTTDEIIKDLHRQFPTHEMFAGTNTDGQQDLFMILKNFSIMKPDIAYCQGEGPIASVLLMHLPVEDAFFTLIQLCDHYLNGYFTPGLETIQMHGRMLTSLLKRHNNYVYKVLKKQRIDSNMYMTEWFMCVFSRTLPWPTVLRVWDMFFCEGIKIVFRVALVILNSIEPDLRREKCLANDKLAETMEILKNLPKKYLEIDYLVPKVIEMNLCEKDLESEHLSILKKMKKKK